MAIVAKFSNGFTDEYKGTRKVSAAWMIVSSQTGEVIASGHSLDRVKAGKTALGNLSIKARGFGEIMPTKSYHGIQKLLSKFGYAGPNSVSAMLSWSRKKNEERLSRIYAAHTIEIIDL